MANHKSSIKRIRSNDAKRLSNRYHAKTMRNAIKDLRTDEVSTSAAEKLPKVIAMVDKLAKKNVIHKNKAANLKSKLTKKVNVLVSTAKNPVKVESAVKTGAKAATKAVKKTDTKKTVKTATKTATKKPAKK